MSDQSKLALFIILGVGAVIVVMEVVKVITTLFAVLVCVVFIFLSGYGGFLLATRTHIAVDPQIHKIRALKAARRNHLAEENDEEMKEVINLRYDHLEQEATQEESQFSRTVNNAKKVRDIFR
jgi:cell division protein FtsB